MSQCYDSEGARSFQTMRSAESLITVQPKKVSRELRRTSCPARFLIPAINKLKLLLPESGRGESNRPPLPLSDLKVPKRCHSVNADCSNSKIKRVEEPPYAPGTSLAEVKRGFAKTMCALDAKCTRWWFKQLFAAIGNPFRSRENAVNFDNFIRLTSFLIINQLPFQIYSLVVLVDGILLSELMPTTWRTQWLVALGFLGYYQFALNILLLMRTLARLLFRTVLRNHRHRFWWVDWEGMFYQFLISRVIPELHNAANNLWEAYQQRIWGCIRGIQAEVSEKRQAIHEGCAARNLPPLVEGMIFDFVCLKGIQELDYRWYLHDNRKNCKALKGLDYTCRETIASFLIPEPAFALGKGEIVDLYCA